MKYSLNQKLLALFFGIFSLATGALTYFAYTSSRNAMLQEFHIRGRTLAKAIASESRLYYQRADVEGFTTLLQSLGETQDVVAVLSYRESRELWVEASIIDLSGNDLRLPDALGEREQNITLAKERRVTEFISPVLGTLFLQETGPARPLWGWIRVLVDRQPLVTRLDGLLSRTLLVGGAIVATGAIFFAFLLRRSLRVIGPLTEATRQVAQGNLHVSVPIASTDELGELAACFNSMTEQLLNTTVSKNYVDNIIRSMIDTLIVFNPDCTIRSVNHAALLLLGYEEHELLGRHVAILFPSKEGFLCGNTYEALLHKGVIDHGETMYRTKDGRTIPMLFSAAVMWNEDGGVQGIACVAKDMTELKQAEEQLRLHGAALASAANAVVITDRRGRVTWVNPSFTTLTGYASEEVIGRDMRILKSGRHDQPFYQTLWETILSGKVWHGEIINRRKDGSLYTEEETITPVHDRNGVISHFIGIKQDITVRKQIEEALVASEEYNRTLFDLSPIGLALFDMTGTIVDCNEAYAAIVGLTRNEALGTTYWELTPKEYDEQAYNIMEVLTKTGCFRNYEKHYIHRDGHLVPVRLFGRLIERDNVLYIWCSVEDITDRRQADEALQAALQKLTELNEARSQFFADISHELRTPLTVIRGEAEVTLRGKDKPVAEYKTALERIVQLTNQVNKLVGDLLFLSRSESGTIEIDKHPVPLLDILQEVHQEAHVLAERKHITVTLHTRSNTLIVNGDPQRLRQLFMTIVDNAVHYTRPGGSIEVDLDREGDYAGVVVADNGIGIPEAELPRVFQRFYRVKRAHHHMHMVHSGSGLGLPIAKWIAETHDGNISIASVPDQGTVVTIRLPLYRPPTTEAL